MFRAAKLLVVLIHGVRGPSGLLSRCCDLYKNPLKSGLNQQFPFGTGSWKGNKIMTIAFSGDQALQLYHKDLQEWCEIQKPFQTQTTNQPTNRPWRSLIWAKEANVHIETARNSTCLPRRPPTARRIAALLRWQEGEGLTQLSEMGGFNFSGSGITGT